MTILVAISAYAQVSDCFQDILPVTDRKMMKSLNGQWSLKVVKGISEDAAVPTEDGTWGKIPVPGCWEPNGFCKPKYDSPAALTGYYRTAFNIPDQWRGMRIVMRLDGVLYGYDLWINGKKAGEWRSAYNTALFDITDFINMKKEKQQLAMRVITHFPGSDFDYNDDWAPCGIFRDVTLFAIPKTHLSDLTITTKNSGEVSVNTKVANGDKSTTVSHVILDAKGKKVGTDKVMNPNLWTAETPYLYTLRTTLSRKGKTLQTFEHKFGFRELTIDGKILKLNGQPIKLRGVTCHSTDPKTAKVISDELTLKDMRLMKEASINYIRTSHYPREPRFYELADSLGFYVIDEVPFGYGDKNLSKDEFYPVLQQRAQATIRRDKNHASVLIWSLGNENPLTDICLRLGDYVKAELDPSRPVCYPQIGSYFRNFNYDFPKVADIYAPHYPTTSQLACFYQKADRPVIFTEYCHTLGISLEDHDRQWEIIERTPCIAGGSVWEWVDQGMPFTCEPRTDMFGYEEKVYTSKTGGFEMYGNKGTDGLLYADRTPLPNYYELQHNYARAAVTDSILNITDGQREIPLHIRNRFDFLNLKDNASFSWTLTEDRDTVCSGAFSPDCRPHATTTYSLSLPTSPDTDKICILNIEISDAHGNTFNRQAIRINPADITRRLLDGLDEPTTSREQRQSLLWLCRGAKEEGEANKTDNPMSLVQGEVMVRAGRKATLAEKLKVGDKRLEKYLLTLSADGASAGTIKTDIKTEQEGNATHYTFALTPDTTDTFLSELGIAFLLDKKIDRVQWIGQGMMPTYPGRYRAGRYGFWAMQQGDLYFEGNRRGVDAAMLTDGNGDGLLLVCNNGNVSFEQTDRGIVLTYNAAVSGEGPKFARTAFPVIANKVGTVGGDFYLYRIDKTKTPQLLSTLFAAPKTVPAPFHPFETQYDTYLMRFEDVVR